MASDDFVDSASFRDPSGHVYRIDGRIYRTVLDCLGAYATVKRIEAVNGRQLI